MTSPEMIEQLDNAIDFIMANPDAYRDITPEVRELAQLAAELRLLPRTAFKERLRADLQEQAAGLPKRDITEQVVGQFRSREGHDFSRAAQCLPSAAASAAEVSPSGPSPTSPVPFEELVMPTLFGAGQGYFPVRRTNFVASFLLHAAATALVLTSGLWMVQNRDQIKPQVTANLITDISPYVLPPAPDKAGGGGGGGDQDKLAESKGNPPRFSREQFAPPAVVLRNEQPKLAVEPTVVGPPSLSFPQTPQVGNPLSAVLNTPSNGPGFGGGIGSGSGGGVGTGHGPGVGPGSGGGIGGGIFRVGGGVSAPRAIYDPEPEYSEEARKAKYQGSVVLWVVIDANGRPRDIKVQRSLGMGLDEKAIEAVRNWKFEPARKDGQPVAVQVNIEVNFRLY